MRERRTIRQHATPRRDDRASIADGFIRALAAAALLLQLPPSLAQPDVPSTITAASSISGTRLLGGALAVLVQSIDLAEQKKLQHLPLLKELQRQLEALESKLNEGSVRLDDDLISVCRQYYDAIVWVNSNLDSRQAFESLEAMARDVGLKNEFGASKAPLLGQPLSLQVEVRVETLLEDSRTPVTGYQIIATPWAFAERGIWLFNFSSPTNDAVRMLTPGVYRFQASRAGRKTETQMYEVGARGSSKEVKNLFVTLRAP